MLETRFFDSIEVDEAAIIYFASGIPGFEELNRYVLMEPAESAPLSFLQSVDEKDICFILADPFLAYPQYEFEIPPHIIKELQIDRAEDVIIRVVVTAKSNWDGATINLMAPLLIHRQKLLGRQLILHNTGYKTRHPILPGTAKT